MEHSWWLVFIIIAIFYNIVSGRHHNQNNSMDLADEASTETDFEPNENPLNDDVKTSFGKLLHNIVEVNEKRIDAIQELTKLQELILTKNRIKWQDDFIDNDSEEEFENQNAILTLVDNMNQLPLRRSNKEEYSNIFKAIKFIILQKNIPKKRAHKSFDKLLYRRSWLDSCKRKAAKVCKVACFRAFKNSCSTYKCSKRAKRTFKRECTRSCKQKFEADRTDSEE